MEPYCVSRFRSIRWTTREVMIGRVGVGRDNPLRIQSMTTADTLDVEATARQSIELAESGCEIVRITAPNVRASEALGEIVRKVRAAGIDAPLVADIHFMPDAAMEAAKQTLGDPIGVARVLTFLASDEGSYVRGTIFTR